MAMNMAMNMAMIKATNKCYTPTPYPCLWNLKPSSLFEFRLRPEVPIVSMVPLKLPKNKIEGLLFMVTLDQQNTLSNSKCLFQNKLSPIIKFAKHNLWFTSLIKYNSKNFLKEKVGKEDHSFVLLYSSFLRELMVESIQTPEQLYNFLIDFAKNHNDKKLLWLFTLLKTNNLNGVIDYTNTIEIFVAAVESFVSFDNTPTKAVEHALKSSNNLYKTFLLSMIGSSYGKDFYSSLPDHDLSNFAAKFL